MVRWRFDYFDAKPSKVGQWCRPGEGADSCISQSNVNLRRAAVEVKEALTARTYTIAECDGPDFVGFSWIGGACVGATLGKIKGTRELRSQVIGLILHTRDYKCAVLIDGSAPKVIPRTAAEKAVHLLGHAR